MTKLIIDRATLGLDTLRAVKELLVEKNIITNEELVDKVLGYNKITMGEYLDVIEGRTKEIKRWR